MKQNIIGIVCSKNLEEAYCLENSRYHKKEIKEKGIETKIIYISHACLNDLVHESFEDGNFKWNIERIKEYSLIVDRKYEI